MGIAISDHHSHGGRGLSAKQATDISRCPDKLDNFKTQHFFRPGFVLSCAIQGLWRFFCFDSINLLNVPAMPDGVS